VVLDRAGGLRHPVQQEHTPAHAGAVLGRDDQVVAPEAAQAREHRGVLHEDAAALDEVRRTVGGHGEVTFEPLGELLDDADEDAVARGPPAVIPIELPSSGRVGDADHDGGERARRPSDLDGLHLTGRVLPAYPRIHPDPEDDTVGGRRFQPRDVGDTDEGRPQ